MSNPDYGSHCVREPFRDWSVLAGIPLLFLVAAMAGCATRPADPEADARRHANNLAAAEQAGYRIVVKDGQTLFCATEILTGSHILPPCVTETRFEQQQLWVWQGSSWVSTSNSSGRSPYAGTLGY